MGEIPNDISVLLDNLNFKTNMKEHKEASRNGSSFFLNHSSNVM